MLRFPSLAALPAAAASRTRTRQRVLAAAAAEEAGEPSGRVSTATRRVTPLEYKRQSGRTAELVMQTEAELMHVALGVRVPPGRTAARPFSLTWPLTHACRS